jgi:predicted PurR-regulated permease PerM
MPVADFTALDGLWVALSVLCVVVALTLGLLLLSLAGTAGRLTRLIAGLEQELLPVITKVGGTIDRANLQLDKVDQVTDSAVDAAAALDTAIRAVTVSVARPVQRISGLAAGIAHGFASFRMRHDRHEAWEAGRAAAARREEEIAAELTREGETR